MKGIVFEGSSLADIKAFSDEARQNIGYQLHKIQLGEEPNDWKPMPIVGAGVREIRVHVGKEFRILYVAKFEEAVYVLHAFNKKTQKTRRQDIDSAKQRYSALVKRREGD